MFGGKHSYIVIHHDDSYDSKMHVSLYSRYRKDGIAAKIVWNYLACKNFSKLGGASGRLDSGIVYTWNIFL
jgi:hypothetical protein